MPTFNGETLLITLDPVADGVLDVDIGIDLYTEWKTWAAQGNLRYPAAFRTTGGDELTAIINAGSYFFLRNDSGWRIKSAENDATYYLVGNLAAQDTTLPVFVPTTGTFTAAILGLQPVTQGVTPVMGSQLAYASFNGGVWVDSVSGLSGTESTASGEPIGNAANPVDNIPDAVTICEERGLPKTIYIIGNLTIGTGDDISGFKVIGQNAARTTLTVNSAALTLGCEILECTVSGILDGLTIIRYCSVGALNYFNGFLYECEIIGPIILGAGAQASILGCYSAQAGQTTPTIDMGGTGQSLSLRKYSGGIKLENKMGSDSVSIDLIGGQVRLDMTTVTNGQIVARGNGKVVNDANGDWLPHGEYGDLILDNETSYGLMMQEMWTQAGLDPDAPMTVTPTTRVSGNISQTITGDGETTSTVTRT